MLQIIGGALRVNYLLFQQPDNVIFVMDASIGQACESQVSYLNFKKTEKLIIKRHFFSQISD